MTTPRRRWLAALVLAAALGPWLLVRTLRVDAPPALLAHEGRADVEHASFSEEAPLRAIGGTTVDSQREVERADLGVRSTAPPGAYWIDGRVILPPGTPADEEVLVVARGSPLEKRRPYEDLADGDGRFRVAFSPATKTGLLTLAGRYVVLEEPVRVDVASAGEVVLEPALGGRIEGRVLASAEGDDLSGSLVRLTPPFRGFPAPPGRTAELGPDATFHFDGVRAGDAHSISLVSDVFRTPTSSKVTVAPAEVRRLDLIAQRGAAVIGRVVDEAGRPVADAYARLQSRTVLTDVDGRFRFGALPGGNHEVHVDGSGFSSEQIEVSLAEGQTREVTVEVNSGQFIAGRVVWPDGRPVPHASLILDGSRATTGEADDTGAFRVSGLRSGLYTVWASAGRDPVWRACAEDVSSGTQDLVLTLRPGNVLEGRVVDGNGAPVKKYTIRATAKEGDPLLKSNLKVFRADDGRFALEGVADGPYEVSAEAAGFAPMVPVPVELPGAGPLELVLAAGATVHVRVVDASGRPVGGARLERVQDRATWLQIPNATTDDAGRCELPNLAPGPLSLSASADDLVSSGPVEVVVPESGAVDVELTLRAGATLTGDLDPSLGDIADRPITVTGPARLTTKSDAGGHFELRGLAPGKYRVSLRPAPRASRRPFTALADAQVELTAGQATHVVLGSFLTDGVRISGRVLSASEPLVGLRVTVRFAEGTTMCATDALGGYELQVPRFGTYDLEVQGEGMWVILRWTVEASTSDLDLDLGSGRIEGAVRRPDGAPAEGIQVHLTGVDGSRRIVLANAAGRYAFAYLSAGKYTLNAGRAERPGIELREGETLSGVDLVLER